MTRSRTALLAVAAAALLAGGCTGSKTPDQSAVRDDIHERLVDPGYVAEPGAEPLPLSDADAETVAECASRALFESDFTKEEREAAIASDGDAPDEDLVLKVENVIRDCYDAATAEGPSAPGDDDETTTTTD